ncbi:hypothetical protein H072_1821 [Dactylellina haptotyla CBS 200.50]|uniref:Methyltransferase domain-containing protein n=1 Tax=Dactylellina haptotyla (strain CBS 200.50) TaxID=1284197 RepID=S8C903_DACHA|nr:hypothetical protein H072_1821 [Dactylellina haptotyla CBS 200.50]
MSSPAPSMYHDEILIDVQGSQEELFHHVYLLRLNGRHFLAPIDKEKEPEKILDLGTGYGNWCLDMASIFPDAKIIGNELSPIQPTYVPPNVSFEIDDFNEEWTHHENSFDFVHARALYGSVKDWPTFLRNCHRILKPGAWFESVETVVEIICDDGSIPEDAPIKYWVDVMKEAGERSGMTFDVAGNVEKWCKDAGFVEVTQRVFKIPVGPWPKDKYEKTLGSYNLLNMLHASEGFSLHLLTKLGNLTVEEVYDLVEKVRADMKNKKYHSYFRLYVCTARKAEEPAARPQSRGSTIRPGGHSSGETDCGSILEESEAEQH